MFNKVLIAEDIDIINAGLNQALTELGIKNIHHAKYCDDALLKIKANYQKEPFDLLISDLSFEPDHRAISISTGEELIAAAKKIQPNLKIITYSVEDRAFTVKNLLHNLQVEAYVQKGRHSIAQLKTAIEHVAAGKTYISPELAGILKDKSISEIDQYDVQLIQQLALGIPQEKMENRFKELGITPNSKSTIEKRISKLKDCFMAKNTVHLISIAKDLGIT